jgi:hypothetical protein
MITCAISTCCGQKPGANKTLLNLFLSNYHHPVQLLIPITVKPFSSLILLTMGKALSSILQGGSYENWCMTPWDRTISNWISWTPMWGRVPYYTVLLVTAAMGIGWLIWDRSLGSICSNWIAWITASNAVRIESACPTVARSIKATLLLHHIPMGICDLLVPGLTPHIVHFVTQSPTIRFTFNVQTPASQYNCQI